MATFVTTQQDRIVNLDTAIAVKVEVYQTGDRKHWQVEAIYLAHPRVVLIASYDALSEAEAYLAWLKWRIKAIEFPSDEQILSVTGRYQ